MNRNKTKIVKSNVPKQYRTKEFLKEQLKWYAKLKQNGFVDLEFLKSDGDTTHHLMKNSLFQIHRSYRSETEYYYRRARYYQHRGEFKDKVDAKIWEMHAEGLSYTVIQKKLAISVSRVRRIVKTHRAIMLAMDDFDKIEADYVARKIKRFEGAIRAHSRQKAERRKRHDGEGGPTAISAKPGTEGDGHSGQGD